MHKKYVVQHISLTFPYNFEKILSKYLHKTKIFFIFVSDFEY